MAVVAGTSPVPGLVLLVVGTVLALAGASGDAGGRLLAWSAAAVLIGAGVRALLLRPVLRADASGLSVVDGLRRTTVSWAQVEGMRVVRDRRTPLLELDLGRALVVLSRSRLGRPPTDVLADLSALQEQR